MNASLWTCQAVLALVFTYSGLTKGTQPISTLVARGQTGVADIPVPVVRFAATAELLGVVGLLAPRLLHVWPVLTPIAAVGLGMIMLLAAGVHLQRREYRTALGNAALLALCATVAVGRFLGY